MEKGEVEFFSFLVERSIKTLYIQQLRQVEDLLDGGFIDEQKFEYLRNRILDCGNEQIRNCRDIMEQYLEIKR